MPDATTSQTATVPRDVRREEILDRFRADHPDLAEAMQLAAETEAILRAFEEGRTPTTTYTSSSTVVVASPR
jgi:hypothetical protein